MEPHQQPLPVDDNVVVLNGCTLTIEPGVIVLGDFRHEVFGALRQRHRRRTHRDYVGELSPHDRGEHGLTTLGF